MYRVLVEPVLIPRYVRGVPATQPVDSGCELGGWLSVSVWVREGARWELLAVRDRIHWAVGLHALSYGL